MRWIYVIGIGSEGSVLFQGEGFGGGDEQMGKEEEKGKEKRQGCWGVGECDE